MQSVEPTEIYNLAAQSFVAASWQQPVLTGAVTGLGAVNVLEAMRIAAPKARFYQASSSEMFGRVADVVQSERTPFYPRSPYACAKLYAHTMTINYRESYGLHASCGILFNHESPLRGIEFVTRKITDGVARIRLGLARELRLGNLEARRDWGMRRITCRQCGLCCSRKAPMITWLQPARASVCASFCRIAFAQASLDAEEFLSLSNDMMRPAEVDALHGDATKAREVFGWKAKTSVEDMAGEMVEADHVQAPRPNGSLAARLMQRILVTGSLRLRRHPSSALPGAAFPCLPPDRGPALTCVITARSPRRSAPIRRMPASISPRFRRSRRREAQPDAARQGQLFGTLALARALLEAAPGCLLLHVSTADAYGRSFRGGAAATEATQFDPMNTYAGHQGGSRPGLG